SPGTDRVSAKTRLGIKMKGALGSASVDSPNDLEKSTMSSFIDPRERARAHAQTPQADFYAEAVKASQRFRKDYGARLNLVKAADMPFERSPDGLIKHIINEKMDTKECCLDIYMQFLPPGQASGKHRHLSEEVIYV